MDHSICFYDFHPQNRFDVSFYAAWYLLYVFNICDLINHKYEGMRTGIQTTIFV